MVYSLRKCTMSLPAALDARAMWDDSLSTGISAIDDQHRDIAQLGAKMLKESGLSLTSEEFGDYFADFWRLVADHFDAEEKIMRTLNLPDDVLQAHIHEHSALLERLIQLNIHSAAVSERKNVSDIAHEVITIVVDHIVHFDLALRKTSAAI